MTNEVTSIGVGMETDGVERGIRTLQQLASQGPRVEKSMQGVEAAAAKADKSLKGLGDGADKGLKDIGSSSASAEQGLGRVAKTAEDAKRSMDGMAKSASSIGASIQTAPVTRGIDSVKTSALDASKAVDLLKSALAVTGIGIGVKEVIGLADGYTKFTAQLRLATKGADDYAAAMGSVRRISMDAQQGLAETGTLYARIANGTAELGLSQRKLSEITETVALSLKVSGATANESASAMLQLSQAFASGVLRGEEFNAVNEAAPRLMKALADGIGVPIGALREMASEGKITSQVMADALPKALIQIRKEAESIQTIGGSFTNLRTKVMEFVGAADQASGATKIISAGVLGLANNLDVATVAAGGLALVMGGRYIGTMASAAVASNAAAAASTASARAAMAGSTSYAIMGAAAANASVGVTALSVASRAASGVLAAFGGPIGLLVTGLGAAAAAFLYFRDTSDEAIKSIGGLQQPLDDLKKKLDALPPEKRVSVIIDIEKSGRDAIKQADSDIEALVQSVAGAANIKMPLDEFERLTDNIRDTAKSGGDLTPILQRAAESGNIPQNILQKWLNLAANIRAAKDAAATASGVIAAAATNIGGDVAEVFPGKTDTALRKEAESVLKATSSYKSKAEQMAEVRKQGDTLRASLKELTDANMGTSKTADDLRSRLVGVDERLTSMAKSGRAAADGSKKVESAYASLSKRVGDYIEQLRIEALQGDKATAAQKAQIQLNDLLANSKGKVTAAKVSGLQADIQTALLMEKEANAIKLATDQAEEAAKAYDAVLEGAEKRADALRKQIQTEEQATAAIGLSKDAIAGLEAAKLNDLAASIERRAVIMDDIDLSGQLSDALRAEAQSYRDLASAKVQRGIKQANYDTAKQAEKDWEKVSDTIGKTLSDYIMGGGKDAAQYLKRLFSTLVLQPIVQTAVGSLLGQGGSAIAGGGSTGGLGGIGNIFSTGKSIYSAIQSPIFSDFGLGLGMNATSAGEMLFKKGFETAGTQLMDLGTVLAKNADAINIAGDALGYANAIYSLSKGQYGTAAGAAIGTYFGGPIGSKIGSTIGSLVDKIFAGDSGTPHMGAASTYSGGSVSRGWVPEGSWEAGVQTTTDAVALSLGKALDAAAKTFGKEAGYTLSSTFSDDTSKDGAFGALKITDSLGKIVADWSNYDPSWGGRWFDDGEAGVKQWLTATAGEVKVAILQMDLPGWANQILNAASDIDSINASLQKISTIKSIFESLGQTIEGFSGITSDLQTQLLNASGGIDALFSSAGTFYQSFYSEQERMDKLSEQLRKSLSALGSSIDPSIGENAKVEFRDAVKGALDAGQAELVSKLLAMSGSFAQAADYAKKAAETAADAAKQAADAEREKLNAVVDGAYANLEAAVGREKKYWASISQSAQDAIGTLSSTLNLLTSNSRELYGTIDSTQQMMAAQGMVYIEDALSAVRGGASSTGFDQLQNAISAARGGISGGVYATQFERERDALVLAGQLSELGDLTDSQLTIQERQLKAAKEQIDLLDETLDYWQKQIDGTNGVIDATMSVYSAVNALAAALESKKQLEKAAMQPGGGGGGYQYGGGNPVLDQVIDFGNKYGQDAYYLIPGVNDYAAKNQSILDISSITGQSVDELWGTMFGGMGSDYWKAVQTAGDLGVVVNASETLDEILRKAGVPGYAVGANYIPNNQLAMLHEGEAVIPKAFNPWAGGNDMFGSGSSEIVSELRSLRELVSALKDSSDATANNTMGIPQMVDQIDTVSAGGNAFATEVMA